MKYTEWKVLKHKFSSSGRKNFHPYDTTEGGHLAFHTDSYL